MSTARKANAEQEEWMSLGEAARVLKATRQTVLARVVKGELEGKHIAGRTVISRESVNKARKVTR